MDKEKATLTATKKIVFFAGIIITACFYEIRYSLVIFFNSIFLNLNWYIHILTTVIA